MSIGPAVLHEVEGPADVVLRLVDRIADDPRHRNFRLLRSQPLAKRRLSRWSMRFLLRENVEALLLAIELESSMAPRRVDEVIALLFTSTDSAP